MDYWSPYSPQGVRRAREHLTYLMSSTNGKLMDSIRYKTGQYRNSCPVKPHNNAWHISALTSQDSNLTTSYNEQQFNRRPDFPNRNMNFAEDVDVDFSFTRQQSQEQRYRGDHQLSTNKQNNTTIPGEHSRNPDDNSGLIFDDQLFGGQTSTKNLYKQQVDKSDKKRKHPDSDQSDNSSDDLDSQSDDTSDEQGSQSDEVPNDYDIQSQSEKNKKTLQGPSNNPNKRSHSAIEDLQDQLGDFIKKFRGETEDSQFSGQPDGNTIKYHTSLMCDLCDFMTPPNIFIHESHKLMYEHLQQQKHNSASLIKTRLLNGKHTMVSVIRKNYKAVSTEPHIIKSNSIMPMCPYPECMTFHATKWHCATHYNLFHNNAVTDCYGVGKVLERKTVKISSDTKCTVCHKDFETIKQLNKHERKFNHMPVYKAQGNQRWIYFCPYCKTMSSKYFQVKSHIMHGHRNIKDLAMDVVLIELPDKHLTLPPVENKPIEIELQQEISALLEMRKVPQCAKRKRHKKILNQRIIEMKKMRKACAKKLRKS